MSLQPNDMLSLMQACSARPLRLPIFVLLNYIKQQLAQDDEWVAYVNEQIALIESKADEEHTHIMAEITDLEAALALKADITALTAGLATKAAVSHTHTAAQITDFTSSVNSLVTTAINNLVNGAPAALDTLKEIADQLASDESALTALTAVVATKANTSALANYVLTTTLTSTLASYVTSTSLSTTLSAYATTAALASGLAGKANTSHTHVMADITDLAAAMALKLDKPSGTANQYLNGLGAVQSRAVATPARTIGTAWQPHATRDTLVIASIPVQCNAVLLVGARVSALFRYADTAPSNVLTTNIVTLPGDDFGLPSGLVTGVYGTLKLIGVVPAGKFTMINLTNVAGSPTVGALAVQEIQL